MAGAGPRPAAADIHQQLAAAMQRMGMDEDEMVADDHLCVVCLEHARDEVLVPCGHMVLCHGCCAKIMSSDTNECPMCRCVVGALRGGGIAGRCRASLTDWAGVLVHARNSAPLAGRRSSTTASSTPRCDWCARQV
jgi:hypothetical protein